MCNRHIFDVEPEHGEHHCLICHMRNLMDQKNAALQHAEDLEEDAWRAGQRYEHGGSAWDTVSKDAAAIVRAMKTAREAK